MGRKGEGTFERVSWDAALDAIAARLAAIAVGPAGPQAILSYSGTLRLVREESLPLNLIGSKRVLAGQRRSALSGLEQFAG